MKKKSDARTQWTPQELAYACDVCVQGIKSGVPFSGNPIYINAMETAAHLFRSGTLSVRRDGVYFVVRIGKGSR